MLYDFTVKFCASMLNVVYVVAIRNDIIKILAHVL